MNKKELKEIIKVYSFEVNWLKNKNKQLENENNKLKGYIDGIEKQLTLAESEKFLDKILTYVDDSDKHWFMCHKADIKAYAKIYHKEQLNLCGVSNNEVALKAFVEEFVEAWEDGMGGDSSLYDAAKRLL